MSFHCFQFLRVTLLESFISSHNVVVPGVIGKVDIDRSPGATKTHLNAHHSFVDERRKINFLHRFLVILYKSGAKVLTFFQKTTIYEKNNS